MSNRDQSYIIPVTNTTKRIELNLVYTNLNVSVQRLLGSLQMYSLLSEGYI